MYRFTNGDRTKRRRLLRDPQPSSSAENDLNLFKDLRFYIHTDVNTTRRRVLYKLISKYGGSYSLNADDNITHILVDEGISGGRLCRNLSWTSVPRHINVLMVGWLSASVQAHCCLNEFDFAITHSHRRLVAEVSYVSPNINVKEEDEVEENEMASNTPPSYSPQNDADNESDNFEYVADEGSTFDDGLYGNETSCDENWLFIPPPDLPVYEVDTESDVSNSQAENSGSQDSNSAEAGSSSNNETPPPAETPPSVEMSPLTERPPAVPLDERPANTVGRLSRIRLRTVYDNNDSNEKRWVIVSFNRDTIPPEPQLSESDSVASGLSAERNTNEESSETESVKNNSSTPLSNIKNEPSHSTSTSTSKSCPEQGLHTSDASNPPDIPIPNYTHSVSAIPLNISECLTTPSSSAEKNANERPSETEPVKSSSSTVLSNMENQLSNSPVASTSKSCPEQALYSGDASNSTEISIPNDEHHVATIPSNISECLTTPMSSEAPLSDVLKADNSVSELANIGLSSRTKSMPQCSISVFGTDIVSSTNLPGTDLRQDKKNIVESTQAEPNLFNPEFILPDFSVIELPEIESPSLCESLPRYPKSVLVPNLPLRELQQFKKMIYESMQGEIDVSNPEVILPDILIPSPSVAHVQSSSITEPVPKSSDITNSILTVTERQQAERETVIKVAQKGKMLVESVTEVTQNERVSADRQEEKMIGECVAGVSEEKKMVVESSQDVFQDQDEKMVVEFATEDYLDEKSSGESVATSSQVREDKVMKFVTPQTKCVPIFSPTGPDLPKLPIADPPYPVHLFRSSAVDSSLTHIMSFSYTETGECIPFGINFPTMEPELVESVADEMEEFDNSCPVEYDKNNAWSNALKNPNDVKELKHPNGFNYLHKQKMQSSAPNVPNCCSRPDISSRGLFFPLPEPSVIPDSTFFDDAGATENDTIGCYLSPDGPNLFIIKKLMILLEWFKKTNDIWRVHAYERAIVAIGRHPKLIESFEEVESIYGVGRNIAHKVYEIVRTGELEEIEDFCTTRWEDTRKRLTKAWGIPPYIAKRFYLQELSSVDDLWNKAKLSYSQRVGLRYYEELNQKMSRLEAQTILQIIMRYAFEQNSKVTCDACSSLRRNKQTCGFVSVLVTLPLLRVNDHTFLPDLVSTLHGEGYLVEDLIRHEVRGLQTKYTGIFQVQSGSKRRRVEITVCPRIEQAFAKLFLTGPTYFNRAIQKIAENKDIILDEHCFLLRVLNMYGGTQFVTELHVPDEKTIFALLRVPYRTPEQRDY